MQNRQLTVICMMIGIAMIVTFSMFYSQPILQAFGVVTLAPENVAKTIQVRINPVGSNFEGIFDSFSRVGFVSGEANFLLESVPSKDKKTFYKLVKASLEDKKQTNQNTRMNVYLDVFSGDGKIIETLSYKGCRVTEYFIHGVDSKGTIRFTEDDGTVEIREVTKFQCISFSMDTQVTDEDIKDINKSIKIITDEDVSTSGDMLSIHPKNPLEGELFFNSMTNTLQQYKNNTWVDITSKGGPPTPRK
jgi:hypothetical protein